MNIHDAIRESAYEFRRKQAHVSGQADQIDLRLPERRHNFGIMLFADTAFGRNQLRVQSAPLCRLQPGSIRAVGDHYSDFRVKPAGLDGIRNGLKIGAASGKQDAKFFERGHARRTAPCGRP